MVPPPDMDRVEAAERLLAGKNWLKAATAADDLFQSYPLCIDLQRIADEALANLGPSFAAARARLRAETAAFVGRLPGLTALSYDGGVPFVSPATRAWLDELAHDRSKRPAPTAVRAAAKSTRPSPRRAKYSRAATQRARSKNWKIRTGLPPRATFACAQRNSICSARSARRRQPPRSRAQSRAR